MIPNEGIGPQQPQTILHRSPRPSKKIPYVVCKKQLVIGQREYTNHGHAVKGTYEWGLAGPGSQRQKRMVP